MRDADEMDADRSTRAVLKYLSTDWTDWAWISARVQVPRGGTHVNDPSKSPDGIRPINDL
jgi:hypothetical protein